MCNFAHRSSANVRRQYKPVEVASSVSTRNQEAPPCKSAYSCESHVSRRGHHCFAGVCTVGRGSRGCDSGRVRMGSPRPADGLRPKFLPSNHPSENLRPVVFRQVYSHSGFGPVPISDVELVASANRPSSLPPAESFRCQLTSGPPIPWDKFENTLTSAIA